MLLIKDLSRASNILHPRNLAGISTVSIQENVRDAFFMVLHMIFGFLFVFRFTI